MTWDAWLGKAHSQEFADCGYLLSNIDARLGQQRVSDRDSLQVGRNHMRNGSFESWRFRPKFLGLEAIGD